MAHNIDMTNNRANMAFIGSRRDIWHSLGQEMQPGQSIEQWAMQAGLAWNAIKVPAIAMLDSSQFDHLPGSERFRRVEGQCHVVRSDNGQPLGYVSDGYQIVQPIDTLNWFRDYIAVDERFELDTAGSLKRGEIVWAMAKFREPLSIVGEKHEARLLMTTTFDGSGATINKASMVRVVCNNTLDASLTDRAACVKTRHNTRFDAARVGRELAAIAKGFSAYARMAEAMVANHMAADETSRFFKACLDIPFDAKKDDISGKKLAQFDALRVAYRETVMEGTAPNTAWAALNSITRYVDHSKTVRAGDNDASEARILSAQFGSGAALKAKAIGLLMPDLREKVAA